MGKKSGNFALKASNGAVEKEEGSVFVIGSAIPRPSTSSLQMEKKQQCRPLEVVAFGVVIVLMWSLFLLPFILFYFPNDVDQDHNATRTPPNLTAETQLNETLECREDFFREKSTGLCVPDCYSGRSWDVSPVTLAVNIITGVALVIGVGAALIFLILSIFRFKKMFAFPLALSTYIAIDLSIYLLLSVVARFAQAPLFCSSRNYLTLISNLKATPFCTIYGMFFFYLVFQIGCWWFFHVVAFFWKLQYPFHAFKVEKLGRIKHIYIGCVITGLILPLIPILIILADYSVKLKTDESLRSLNATFASGGLGFCNWVNREAILYGFILPLSVLTATGTSLLVLIIRNIHKMKERDTKRAAASNEINRVEVVIVISFCYYFMMGIVTLTSYVVQLRKVEPLREEAIKFFTCEQDGHDMNHPCDISSYHSILNHSVILSFLGYILLSLYPIFHIVYALNVKGLRKKCKSCCGSGISQKEMKNNFSKKRICSSSSQEYIT